MISGLISSITLFIIQVISKLGYFGIGLLMAVQTMAMPVPSEVVIPFAGFLVFKGEMKLFLVALIGALGSTLGGSAAYFIGKKGGRPLVEKYGGKILITPEDLNKSELWLKKFGSPAVLIGMMLPFVRSFISFPAGISKLPYRKFVLGVFSGSFVWCYILAYLGMKMGPKWLELREKFRGADYAILILIVIGIILWVFKHFRRR